MSKRVLYASHSGEGFDENVIEALGRLGYAVSAVTTEEEIYPLLGVEKDNPQGRVPTPFEAFVFEANLGFPRTGNYSVPHNVLAHVEHHVRDEGVPFIVYSTFVKNPDFCELVTVVQRCEIISELRKNLA